MFMCMQSMFTSHGLQYTGAVCDASPDSQIVCRSDWITHVVSSKGAKMYEKQPC